ncbi:MAG: hypothetical protein HYT09_01350 [Candidatus Levybacteria bacterium]|nr:hypothetical protein [Candidatus Levybacteria bacterium]
MFEETLSISPAEMIVIAAISSIIGFTFLRVRRASMSRARFALGAALFVSGTVFMVAGIIWAFLTFLRNFSLDQVHFDLNLRVWIVIAGAFMLVISPMAGYLAAVDRKDRAFYLLLAVGGTAIGLLIYAFMAWWIFQDPVLWV